MERPVGVQMTSEESRCLSLENMHDAKFTCNLSITAPYVPSYDVNI